MMEPLRVLVVDDEKGMLLGVERTLRNFAFTMTEFNESISFSIKAASTGSEGLNLLKSNAYDILILDHKLPDMQGLDILQELKQAKKEILTIMITAFASLEVAISATRNGAFDFLSKPFTPDELKNTVSKAAKHIYLHRKAQKLEEEKKQVRFQFLSILAHELKTPLAAIEGYLNIMGEKVAGDSISSYGNMISRSLTRITGMRKMIGDLLDLTRLESGNKIRNIEDINLYGIAKESAETVMLDARQRNINIHYDGPTNLIFRGDGDEMAIIFNNLLTNAVKYNKDGGEVRLNLGEDAEFAYVSCTDTGIGMTKEEKEKLFHEFTRIKNEKTRNILGSGLGLSILKKIVTLYDGAIEVESEENKGTTFNLKLKKT